MKEQSCPCCNRPLITDGDISLDTAAQLVSRDGRSAKLSKQQFEILEFILRKKGGVADFRQLYDWLYQLSHEEVGPVGVRVQICRMRKTLKPLGIGIETVWGSGYSIKIKEGIAA